MIIDTTKLRKLFDNYYANRAARIDEGTKSDRAAISMLNRLETEQIEALAAVEEAERLWRWMRKIEQEKTEGKETAQHELGIAS